MPFTRWASPASAPLDPCDETQRLEALRRYELLDTPPDPLFDELTKLVSQLCETPIALITLMDHKRQWFKSAVGAGGVTETPREIAFCSHTIEQSELLMVPDTHEDPRFAQNPLVTQAPHLRFYAGFPLLSPEGYALGTLCVLDTRPRDLSTAQQEILKTLSRQVMAQIERRYQHQQIEDLNRRLQRAMDESHHRIKNNLQVLAALVDLQRLKHTDQVPLHELDRISSHIRTLGALHDLLTVRPDDSLEHLSLRTSLERLLPLLQTSCGVRPLGMEITPDCALSHRQTSTVLLLVTELVGNSCKHGAGAITIRAELSSDETLELQVRDRGSGFPADFKPEQSANTGVELIESLACWDLGGTVAYETHPEGGACVTVEFPL